MKKLLLKTAILTASLASMNAAFAVPVFFGGTGHYYEYISTSSTWATARTAALGMTHLGMPGYLATVTSAPENIFLTTLARTGWLGGSDMVSEGAWLWMDGPEAGTQFWSGGPGGSTTTFASWGGGEPNNLGNEDFLELSGGSWNDLPSRSRLGYFVEYDAPIITPQPDPIPVPTTAALFGLGLLGIAGLRKRKQK
ncbi:PEP-CTERM sorting domain-containing protein [Zooshikella marina]|uniref:PEP-CTERM sorting domain-containing protein n=1 Tax=Zooshikella ganghwensis TaxID=202772 RepID=UPI001BB09765|nr:PEP-CTERM sorting domain-containing protein [Zooshikella ganghwensis]MBU2706800.1 PEP-CTERM sorting domain-containing protein [Zooshikella ganghwensis]